MADCTGYGLSQDFTMCTDGPVGNGETANLTVTINGGNDAPNGTFDSGIEFSVADWDGTETVIDILGALGSYGLNEVGCDITAANLTITPDGDTNTGTILLEIILNNCVADSGSGDAPDAFTECMGAGPHTIFEMTTFTLDGVACMAM